MPAAGKFKAKRLIRKSDLAGLLGALRPVPLVPVGGKFAPYEGKIDLLSNLTMNSPIKTHLLPDMGPSFRFDSKTQKALPAAREGSATLFGVHPLDIRALDILDRVFRNVPYYIARRKKTTVIGAGDFRKCGKGFDLFLHDDGLEFLVVAGSPKGEAIIAKHKGFFHPAANASELERQENFSWDQTLSLDPQEHRQAVKGAPAAVWEEVARTCLGCGICSYVCPLCYCFEVEDRLPVGSRDGARCVRWDSCMLESFSEIAGGHVFQPLLAQRIRNWYYHKFSRAVAERGEPDCVGCDRCFHFCPVAINFREVLKNAASANPR